MKQQKKKKGRSVQELLGIKTFTKYGLTTTKGELLFYLVSPTNISVLSHTNIEIKIRHLMMVLSALPDIEIVCTDSSECFDDNKAYLTERLKTEENGRVKKLIKKDIDFLDNIQTEMATARQFFFRLTRQHHIADVPLFAQPALFFRRTVFVNHENIRTDNVQLRQKIQHPRTGTDKSPVHKTNGGNQIQTLIFMTHGFPFFQFPDCLVRTDRDIKVAVSGSPLKEKDVPGMHQIKAAGYKYLSHRYPRLPFSNNLT